MTRAGATLATHGPDRAVFRLASVTKLLSALATLAAVRDGVLHLDEPAGPEGATVRHLLSHASGLPFDEGGTGAAPGTRRVYSNVGYERLGGLVGRRTGLEFSTWVRLEVIEPLGLEDTHLEGSPAHGARGSVADLLALGREWLAPGLIPDGLHEQATTVAFPGLDGVLPGIGRQQPNDWGLGPEIRDGKDPHWTGGSNSPATFGHFGQSGSFLWVDPGAGLACAFLGDREFGAWARQRWPALAEAVLAGAREGTT